MQPSLKTYFICLITILFSVVSFSQKNQEKHLKKLLRTEKNPSKQFMRMIALGEYYKRHDIYRADSLKTVILKLLSDTKQMYGYEITQKVKELTDAKIVITEGALYPLLHQLEAEGVVTTETVNIGKRIRKYYTLTQTGNERAKEKIYEFADFIQTMNILLDLKPSV